MAHFAPALDLQTRFGKLELRNELSHSFFGARHRARSANTGRSGTHVLGTTTRDAEPTLPGAELCAVRVINVETSNLVERLALAASAVCGAIHPALFTPLQVVRERGRLGIVTSDVAGVTLADLVERAASRQEGLPQPIVLRVVLDLIEGLHALEVAGAAVEPGEHLYGGLTPDSIHVGRDGQTRLIDPGVMAAASRQSVWAHDLRMLAYSAPEQHVDGTRHDARVDIFALGVVLWELLSCRPLFHASSAHETIEAVCRARIARVRRERFVRGEPIMATVANVVARALERDPARRFRSYSELAVALRDAAPAADAEQVAAFLAAVYTPERPLAFEEIERDTAKVPRLERPENTAKVPVRATGPAVLPEPHTAAQDTAITVPPPGASTPAPSTPTAASTPASRAASTRGRYGLWALGVSLLVALAAFALLKPDARPATDHEQRSRAAEREPPAQAAAQPEVPAEATTVAPPAASRSAEPAPTTAAPVPVPSTRKARPGVRLNGPKRPFIPDDI